MTANFVPSGEIDNPVLASPSVVIGSTTKLSLRNQGIAGSFFFARITSQVTLPCRR